MQTASYRLGYCLEVRRGCRLYRQLRSLAPFLTVTWPIAYCSCKPHISFRRLLRSYLVQSDQQKQFPAANVQWYTSYLAADCNWAAQAMMTWPVALVYQFDFTITCCFSARLQNAPMQILMDSFKVVSSVPDASTASSMSTQQQKNRLTHLWIKYSKYFPD